MSKEEISLFVPGRLCLFGEHSDWAGVNRVINPDVCAGCAVVTGVEQGIYATASLNNRFIVECKLPEYDGDPFNCEMNMIKLRDVAKEGGFYSYVAGVASYMSEWYQVGGIKICIEKMTLPMKSGLSSSAAICVLVVKAFNELYNLHLNTLGIMNIAYWGELRTPSQCGRLDQACAFGVNPVSMIFDGNEIEVEKIPVKTTLYYVFADLMAGKDTVKILHNLNSAYPVAKNEKEQAVHEALGYDNKIITDLAKEYISNGEIEKLGALMVEAQELFDRKVAPMCPEELDAPVLHSVLNDKKIKEYIFGAKGVGSQGDGTVQLLAKDETCQKKLIEYLQKERKMKAYPLTLRPENDASNSIFNDEIYIFGAKSVAIGAIRAIRKCYMNSKILGCIVSSLEDNPNAIEGLTVHELKEFSSSIPDKDKESIKILVATPIYVQGEICDMLKIFGFNNIVCLDSKMEEDLMHAYYSTNNIFASVKDLEQKTDNIPAVKVYSACHNADRRLLLRYDNDPWVKDIQVGAALTDIKLCELTDATGDNISEKNPTYCELTGLYWMWKNEVNEKHLDDYYGLYQYRRVLDITEDDLRKIVSNDIDLILPYPMIHMPNIKEHHSRYTNEPEWELLLEAVKTLHPEYMDSYDEIFNGEYLYNYNMFLGKGKVVNDLCDWMFPIFFKLEELCKRNGIVPARRYIAYFGESMMTWFFMKNQHDYKIAHTGRLLRN